jgi:hypothetical protein
MAGLADYGEDKVGYSVVIGCKWVLPLQYGGLLWGQFKWAVVSGVLRWHQVCEWLSKP